MRDASLQRAEKKRIISIYITFLLMQSTHSQQHHVYRRWLTSLKQ